MAITSAELEILKTIKEKNGLISMKEPDSRAGLEIGHLYIYYAYLHKNRIALGFLPFYLAGSL